MNIGILTLQGATNYGAVLQALGLSEYLKRQGHAVEIIDYHTPQVYGFYDYHIFSQPISPRSVASKTLRRFRNEREFKAFETFRRQHFAFSKRISNERELAETCVGYDAVICGSDQVWNPRANGGLTDSYFFGCVDGSRVKKLSYAASFGAIETAQGLEGKIADLLADYSAISVRESEAVDFVSSLVDQPVERVIDPSMLLTAEEYAQFERELPTPDHFMLTYMLNGNEAMTQAVAAAQAALNLPVILLGRRMRGSTFIKDIGPGEFLTLYRRADAVITNSFHGTAFALLYGKPFLTFGNGRYNSRMETLLGIAEQESRFCTGACSAETIAELLGAAPSPAFEALVQPERDTADRFLSRALGL